MERNAPPWRPTGLRRGWVRGFQTVSKVYSLKFTQDIFEHFLRSFLLVTSRRRSPDTVLQMAVQADRGLEPRSILDGGH